MNLTKNFLLLNVLIILLPSILAQFLALCPEGYKFNLEQYVCEDIDECKERFRFCKRHELCKNWFGGYECIKKLCYGDQTPFHACKDLNTFQCLSETAANLTIPLALHAEATTGGYLFLRLGADLKYIDMKILESLYNPPNNVKKVSINQFYALTPTETKKTCDFYISLPIEGPQTIPMQIRMQKLGSERRRILNVILFVSKNPSKFKPKEQCPFKQQ